MYVASAIPILIATSFTSYIFALFVCVQRKHSVLWWWFLLLLLCTKCDIPQSKKDRRAEQKDAYRELWQAWVLGKTMLSLLMSFEGEYACMCFIFCTHVWMKMCVWVYIWNNFHGIDAIRSHWNGTKHHFVCNGFGWTTTIFYAYARVRTHLCACVWARVRESDRDCVIHVLFGWNPINFQLHQL